MTGASDDGQAVTEADRATARKLLDPLGPQVLLSLVADKIAAALASERAKARAPFEALMQELASVAVDHHATVAGDAYADAADRILAILEGTYL